MLSKINSGFMVIISDLTQKDSGEKKTANIVWQAWQ